MNAAFFTTAEMCDYLQVAGLHVEEALERNPYAPEVEYQSPEELHPGGETDSLNQNPRAQALGC